MARTTPVHSGYTILSGAGTGTNGSRIDVWAEYKLGASDAAANTTPITLYFYAALAKGNTSSTKYSSGLNSTLTVDGKAGTRVTNGSYDFTNTATLNLLGSFSGNIAHNANGAKTVTITGSFTTKSSYISGGTLSATVTLPTIPRESTVGASAANIGETTTISVNRKNTAYTHSIAYSFGALSGYISEDWEHSDTEVKLTDVSIAFTVPESFYAQIPNDPTGICTLTIRTYSGNTQIGDEKNCTFTVTAANCSPLVTGTVTDVNEKTLTLTGSAKVLIKGHSNACCVIDATAQRSASIVTKRIGGAVVTENERTINGIDTANILFYAEDSRGYSAQRAAEGISFVEYIPISDRSECKRIDPTSGKALLAVAGDWFNGSFGDADNLLLVTYSINGGEEQNVEISTDGNFYSATVELVGLDYTKSHTVAVTVTDCLESETRALTVNRGIPVFDWGPGDFRFNVPVYAPQFITSEEET